MKTSAFLASNFFNAATYFCIFANVCDEGSYYQKTFGKAVGMYWKPFWYEKLVSDAIKVETKPLQVKDKMATFWTTYYMNDKRKKIPTCGRV